MDALAIFNSFEAAFWIIVGAVVFRNSRLSRRSQKLGVVAGVWFILFGISDIIEVFTGAWWRLWSLFALKATCVIVLITCAVLYRRSALRAHQP